MTYTTGALAAISGVSERTLRYYDQIGLLTPPLAANGYRQYGAAEVDRLQLILAYRALDFSLADIRALLAQPKAQRRERLVAQHDKLDAQIARLKRIRAQVDATLTNDRGERTMTDNQKFAAFKNAKIAANTAEFGEEVVAKYGQAAKTAADQRFSGLTAAQYHQMQAAEATLAQSLRAYLAAPALPSAAAKAAYTAHRDWLLATTPQLTAAMHRALGEMYAADTRFAAYYTKLVGDPRAAEALHAIIADYAE